MPCGYHGRVRSVVVVVHSSQSNYYIFLYFPNANYIIIGLKISLTFSVLICIPVCQLLTGCFILLFYICLYGFAIFILFLSYVTGKLTPRLVPHFSDPPIFVAWFFQRPPAYSAAGYFVVSY
uniref:Ovule protein n=1 Tax=Heterorhabditis bacteriophora TaxID=37862 RepID=A0A1I7WHG2_HETBA